MTHTSPFLWQNQPSQINLGRIKSALQRQQDATRVNGYSDTARSTTGDKTKAIVGKPNWARSQ